MTEEQRIRFAEALQRLAGDEDLLIAMGAMVLDDAPVVMAELQQQIEAGQLSQAASTAHKLKGLLSTFDVGGCLLTIQQIITAAKADDQAECAQSWSKCEREIRELLAEVRAVVDPVST